MKNRNPHRCVYTNKCGYAGCAQPITDRKCRVCNKGFICSCGRCVYCSNDFQGRLRIARRATNG